MPAAISYQEVVDAAGRFRASSSFRHLYGVYQLLLNWIPPGARVLDVGCSNGLLLTLIAELTSVELGVGYEPSARAIARAEKIRESLPANTAKRLEYRRFGWGDAWPAEKFDVVVLVDALRCVSRKRQLGLMESAAARVAGGGLLVYAHESSQPRWQAVTLAARDLLADWRRPGLRPFAAVDHWSEQSGMKQLQHERVRSGWFTR